MLLYSFYVSLVTVKAQYGFTIGRGAYVFADPLVTICSTYESGLYVKQPHV